MTDNISQTKISQLRFAIILQRHLKLKQRIHKFIFSLLRSCTWKRAGIMIPLATYITP